MSIPIVSAKLRVPILPQVYLHRPRLDRLWGSWSQKRLILATAGAGFGKTSFLAANARNAGRRTLWYSLDEMDADPATFLTHLREAVRPHLSTPPASAGLDEEFSHAFLAYLVGGLGELDGGILLIFDDLQFVSDSPKILNFLERLLRFLPERCTMILASREPVGIAISRLKSQGWCDSISATDLQFTEQEVEELVGLRFAGSELEPGLSRRIVSETEGWAAGLEILFQLCEGSSSYAIREALDHLTQSGAGWFSYFAEEVVGRLDRATREFLLCSSILPRLDAELCDSVLGVTSSRRILKELCRRNLFTFPTDARGNAYRYHHLFREFLRSRLESEMERGEIERLLLRAGAEFAKAGAWVESAAAFAEGGNPKATLDVIETHGEELLRAGQIRILRRTLDGVPVESLMKNATALSVFGRLEEIQGEWDAALVTYRRGLSVVRRGRRRAELLSLCAQIHLRQGRYDACAKLCKEALDEPGRRRPQLRGRVIELLGVAAAESGRTAEAEEYLHDALSICRKAGDELSEGRVLFLLAVNVHYFRGDFQKATEAARQALVIFQKRDDHRRLGHSLGILGFVAMEIGKEREARELTEKALRIAENIEYRMLEGYCHYTLGKCALLRGESAAARREFELVRRIGEQLREPALLAFPRMGLAEVELAEGNRQAARVALQDALETVTERNDRFKEGQCYRLLGLASEPSQRRRAANHWRKGEAIFRPMGARFELHHILLLRLSEGLVPKKDRAVLIKELLVGVARSGHEFLWFDLESDRAIPLLVEAVRLGIETDYAIGRLMRLGRPIVPHLSRLLEDRSEVVRGRAVELLALVGGEEARAALIAAGDLKTDAGRAAIAAADELERVPLQPLVIEALGPFQLSVGERVLTLDRWRSKRALRLFQLLLLHRFRWVPKDQLIEALWPDAEPEKGENSLKQSVLLLRKVLEPDLKETRLSRYIRFRNDAYRLDPGEGHRYDVEAFEEALARPTRSDRREPVERQIARLRTAIGLYRGSLLQESPYEEFLTEERERLRDRFLDGVGRLLSLYRSSKRWADAIPLSRLGLVEDPYNEEFYETMIQAHLRMRHRKEALAAYQRYERMMTRELGLLPTPRMKLLANQVVALSGGTDRATVIRGRSR